MKKKLLIANRGEIAIRVAKTAHEMGYLCVGLAREKDKNDLYTSSMDEVAIFESDSVQETFLSENEILNICKKYSINLLHPGYGFLSESASFASKLKKAGVTFVGPMPETLKLLGNKISGKALAEKLNIPTIPGFKGEVSSVNQKLKKELNSIGYPLLVKAGAGGGGRGMRIVYSEKELEQALSSSSIEAKRAFGDGTVFIEKFIKPARHIEVQICGDRFGSVIHVFERDCSLQRRFQKIIEVAPAEGISELVLEEMRDASIKLGKASKLIGLATIEFLYDPNEEKFYFMECNPRLQVEHTITEEITNIDLVKLQLEVIEGKALPKQESIRKNGVSIQARICAEVPEDDGRTESGVITNYIIPEGLRLDSGIRACSIITNDFDSLLCKLIVNAENFSQARNKLKSALKDLVITGVPVSSGFLIKLLEYIKSFDTSYISTVGDFQSELEPSSIIEELYQVAAFFYSYVFSGFISLDKFQNTDPFVRNIRPREFQFLPLIEISLHQFETKKRLQIPSYIPFSKDFAIIRSSSDTFKTLSDGKESVIKLIEYNQSSELYLELSINSYHVLIAPAAPELKEGVTFEGDGVIIAPLPGTVLSILVKEGKEVKSGDVLMSFDSMKTEHVLSAPCSGIIELVDVTIGGTIERGQLLIKISTNLKNK